MTSTLPLSEVFGPTFQGEGPHHGRRVGFIRLGLCNLTCAWCDTPYTWDHTRYDVDRECPPTPIDVILDRAMTLNTDTIVLSGGEPMLHAKRTALCPLGALLHNLTDRGVALHVETNGTIAPPGWMLPLIDHWTVSPKTTTTDPEHKRLRPDTLRAYLPLPAAYKFVATSPNDLPGIDRLCRLVGIPPDRVWIMPEGRDATTILTGLRSLERHVRDYGWHLSSRLHVLLHDDKRGV